jgi:hypothetical protein
MLSRCNNLEELSFGGELTALRKINVQPLTLGYWPELKSLIIGNNVYLDIEGSSFATFLSSHRNLKDLSMWETLGYQQPNLDGLDVTIQSFRGDLSFLVDTASFKHLNTLDVATSDWEVPQMLEVLRQLALTTLELQINLDRGPEIWETDHIKVLRSILANCPALLHFKMVCTAKNAFHLVSRTTSLHVERCPHNLNVTVERLSEGIGSCICTENAGDTKNVSTWLQE